jgi:hypothetical protein
MKSAILAAVMVALAASGVPAQTSYEPDAAFFKQLSEKVRVVESKRDWVQFDRQAPTANAGRSRIAYTATFRIKNDVSSTVDIVVVHERSSDKFFEIRGIEDFPWRPFNGLKWIDKDTLQFDQWVNPNNGGRYRVNFKSGKLTAAGYIRSR